jgi:hypothetical protein
MRHGAARCVAERNVQAETIADFHDAGFPSSRSRAATAA